MPALFVGAGLAVVLAPAGAPSGPPAEETFTRSQITVLPGTTISLHWSQSADVFNEISSPAPNAVPNFDSSSVIGFPSPPGVVRHSTNDFWATQTNAMSVVIPTGATNNTNYVIQMVTCNFSACSNASHVTLTVSTIWTTENYTAVFATEMSYAQNGAKNGKPSPTSVTWGSTSSGNAIFDNSEFSDSLGETQPGSSTQVGLKADPQDDQSLPFGWCFNSPCNVGSASTLGEHIVGAGGFIWFTQGGWSDYPKGQTVRNNSEVVGYDPTARTFCNYQLPDNDAEISGLTAVGSGTNIKLWVVETDPNGTLYNSVGSALDSFVPTAGASCSNPISLGAAQSFTQFQWTGGAWPADITADPNGNDLWVTDTFASEVDDFNVLSGRITTSYTYPAHSSTWPHGFAAPSWVLADTNFVYVIDYGDDYLIRINKATDAINEIPVPLTNDLEQGYGVARQGGLLYFSMADDSRPAYDPATTIGYINVNTWPASAPAPTTAVVFSGLDTTVDPGLAADFRSIAISGAGQLAVADAFGQKVVVLNPPDHDLTATTVLPSNNATLSGTTGLDATASDTDEERASNTGISSLQFEISGGNLTNPVLVTAALSIYGWVVTWNTGTVGNGTYTLRSVATDTQGVMKASPGITVTIQN